jgi:hypothetical protein
MEAVNVEPDHPGGSALILQPKADQAKMEKMENFLLEKFPVRVEKIIVYSWQDWSCYLEAVTRGLSSGHKERALCCLFRTAI